MIEANGTRTYYDLTRPKPIKPPQSTKPPDPAPGKCFLFVFVYVAIDSFALFSNCKSFLLFYYVEPVLPDSAICIYINGEPLRPATPREKYALFIFFGCCCLLFLVVIVTRKQ